MRDNNSGGLFLIALVVLVWVALNPQGCDFAVDGSPPFESQDGKPCVYVSADLSPEGNKALGKTHPGIISAVSVWCEKNGGEYRLDDVNAKSDPGDGEDGWVKAAHKIADRTHAPSIVGASRSKGFSPQPLPAKTDDLNRLLDRIKP